MELTVTSIRPPVRAKGGSAAVTITAATESLDGGPAYDLSSVNGPILETTCGDAVGTDLCWFQTPGGFVGAPSLLIRRQPVVG